MSAEKNTLLKILNFANSKELNSHSFWATGQILVSKESQFSDLETYREFFFNFRILRKITPSGISDFQGKNTFLPKKPKFRRACFFLSTLKLKKSFLLLCRAQSSASFDINISLVAQKLCEFSSLEVVKLKIFRWVFFFCRHSGHCNTLVCWQGLTGVQDPV